MANVKTAISIKKSLFKDIDLLAHQMYISRSQLFAIAAKDFVKRHQNRQQLLRQINIAYDDTPDLEEEKWQQQAKNRYRRLVEEDTEGKYK